jgi:hypothetical protein
MVKIGTIISVSGLQCFLSSRDAARQRFGFTRISAPVPTGAAAARRPPAVTILDERKGAYPGRAC